MLHKTAIPTRGNQIDDHFGHCEFYTIYTHDDKSILSRDILQSPEGCGCKSNIADILRQEGVTLMLAGNMGQGAFQVLAAHGINVIRGCSGDSDVVMEQYLRGQLTDSGQGCRNHEHHHEH